MVEFAPRTGYTLVSLVVYKPGTPISTWWNVARLRHSREEIIICTDNWPTYGFTGDSNYDIRIDPYHVPKWRRASRS